MSEEYDAEKITYQEFHLADVLLDEVVTRAGELTAGTDCSADAVLVALKEML